MADLEKLQKSENIKWSLRFTVLNDFVTAVKQECVINQNFFIFFDIPDLIVKKRYSRKDYEDIIKILQKVKTRYLAEKAMKNPDKPLEVIGQITDDDLVELELFDFALSQFQNKQNEKKQTITSFIAECHSNVVRVIQKLNVDSEKTKKNIEQSVISTFLNQRMEQRNTTYFGNNFKHRILY